MSWSEEEFLVLTHVYPFTGGVVLSKILATLGYQKTPLSARCKASRSGIHRGMVDPGLALEALTDVIDDIPQATIDLLKGTKSCTSRGIKKDRVESESQSEEGNYKTLIRKVKYSPQTLKEALKHFEVDEDVWKVEDYKVNKWEVGAKQRDGSIETTPLYQIKLRLVRKNPVVCEWPAVAPVVSSPIKVPKRKNPKSRLKTALVFGDSQNGYRREQRTGYLDPIHDRKAWDLVCQVAEKRRPDVIVILGDMLDLADWSTKFARTPDLRDTTQPTLEELHWWFKRIAMTGAKVVYLEGNHEKRIHSAIVDNTIAAYGIKPANEPDAPPSISVRGFLGLDNLNVEYLGPWEQAEYWINENLRVSHGSIVRPRSGMTAQAVVQDTSCSEIFGHVHRAEYAAKTVWRHSGPKQYVAVTPGTLARLEPGVVPAAKGKNNWQQGFCWIDYEDGNGFFDIHPVSIMRGRMIFQGEVWEAQDPVKQIAKDTNWPSFERRTPQE
jgi:hypothetical protein